MTFKQGDIVKMEFTPAAGHEQLGYRPALVVSNELFNQKTNLTIVCPISNTDNRFPMHIRLQGTATTGFVRCEQVRSLDLNARNAKFVERVPDDILDQVLEILRACI